MEDFGCPLSRGLHRICLKAQAFLPPIKIMPNEIEPDEPRLRPSVACVATSQATGLHYWVCGTARSGLPCRNRVELGKELPGGVNKLIRRRSRLAKQGKAPADASLFDSEGNICLGSFNNRSLSCRMAPLFVRCDENRTCFRSQHTVEYPDSGREGRPTNWHVISP